MPGSVFGQEQGRRGEVDVLVVDEDHDPVCHAGSSPGREKAPPVPGERRGVMASTVPDRRPNGGPDDTWETSCHTGSPPSLGLDLEVLGLRDDPWPYADAPVNLLWRGGRMPVDGPVPWARLEHTGAKHRIYELYLKRWFPILLSRSGYPSATYAEGFAGPGVYTGGEPGSPIIAINALLTTSELSTSTKQTRFVFIDDDPRCVDQLREELKKRVPDRPRSEDQMPVSIKRGTCAADLESTLTGLGAWGQPILAVLDSFGNAQSRTALLNASRETRPPRSS